MTFLYNHYRPKTPDELVGQDHVAKLLRSWQRKGVPHVVGLTGPSGTGKTTTARMIAGMVGCTTDYQYTELNAAADARGIDTVRQIQDRYLQRPLGGNVMWYLDECHRLTPEAQDGMLKVLEDEKPWAYFVLASTEPEKLKTTFKSRGVWLGMKPISPQILGGLILKVAKAEGFDLSVKLSNRITVAADGSARSALMLLQKAMGYKKYDDQEQSVGDEKVKAAAFDLVKAMMPFTGRPDWAACRRVLASVKDENPERFRQLILTCALNGMLEDGKNANTRNRVAYRVISAFETRVF